MRATKIKSFGRRTGVWIGLLFILMSGCSNIDENGNHPLDIKEQPSDMHSTNKQVEEPSPSATPARNTPPADHTSVTGEPEFEKSEQTDGDCEMVSLSNYVSSSFKVKHDVKTDSYEIEYDDKAWPFIISPGIRSFEYIDYHGVMDAAPFVKNGELYVADSFIEYIIKSDFSSSNEPLSSYKIDTISREDAKLDIITPLDFHDKVLNTELDAFLTNKREYEDDAFKRGIVRADSIFIVTDRFIDPIINCGDQQIKIGDPLDTLYHELGEPNIRQDRMESFHFYKTEDYYIGFKGNDTIESAVLCSNENGSYDLKKLLDQLAASPSLNSYSQQNQDMSLSFINGGGYYGEIEGKGVSATDFDEKYIMVYNNFQGELYQFRGNDCYAVYYQNEDEYVNKMFYQIQEYFDDEKGFQESENISKDGKYTFFLYWNYSMSHGLKIRRNDFSKMDQQRGGGGDGTYQWIDDHLLYCLDDIYDFEDVPFTIYNADHYNEISPIMDFGLTQKVGIYDFDFKNPDFTSSQIIFYKENDKESKLVFNYILDTEGNMLIVTCQFGEEIFTYE